MAHLQDEPIAGAEGDFAEGEARRARPRMGRVKAIGNVDIPQEAFLAILKVDS